MSNSPIGKLPGSSSLAGMLIANGASPTTSAKFNSTATIDPTINDDQTQGYSKFSIWINTTAQTIFFCTDPTTGNANWTSGGGMGSSGMTFSITASNSFAIGDVVRFNGTTYQKAQADNPTDAEVVGVIQTATGSAFTFTSSGFLLWTSHGFTPGDVLFLSPTVAGGLQNTDPAVVGQVSKPVAIVLDANNFEILNFRGVSVGADNSAKKTASYVTMATESTLDNERVVTAGSGITITDGGAGTTATWALDVHGLVSAATLAETDEFVEYNATATANKKIAVAALREQMTGAARADIASATTTDLGSITNSYIRITGTTAITSFGTTARTGSIRDILFGGALTLTYNASSLIIPGGVNVTTVAGDTAIAVHEGSGNWRVLRYTPLSGQALVSPGTPTNRQIFTSSGSFTPVTTSCNVILTGAGGGGGGGGSGHTHSSGGGGGGVGIFLVRGLTPGTPITVTCGAAGSGGGTNVGGGTGGTSTFGTYITCTGGTGGDTSGGTPGICSAYDTTNSVPLVSIATMNGSSGSGTTAATTSQGGYCYFSVTNTAAGAAGVKGAGGGGNTGASGSGSAGSVGYCVVTW